VTAPREVLERASTIFGNDKTLHWDRAMEMAGEQVAAEAADETERHAKATALTDSMRRFWTCGCCGTGNSLGAQDGLCDQCKPVVAQLRAERAAGELIGSLTRRQLAERYLERTT
jgi:hypothetical protein